MREIRKMTEEKSQKRGHPVHIAVRVPAVPAIGRHFGLDGVQWAKDGSVDMLIPTNWFTPTNFDLPIELWKREIGEDSTCLVAAGADALFCIAQSKYVKQMQIDPETMRGFTVSAYTRGADAIYIYNNFLSPYQRKVIHADGTISQTGDKREALREIGKLSTALGKPRTHVLTYNEPDIERARPEVPELPEGVAVEFDIHIGVKPQEGKGVIRLGLDSLPGFEDARLLVEINGVACRQIEDLPRDPRYKYDNTKIWHVVRHVSETGARVMQFEADLSALKDGRNRIAVTNDKKDPQALTWLEIHFP